MRKFFCIYFCLFFLTSCSYCEYYLHNKIELAEGDVITYLDSNTSDHNLYPKKDLKKFFKPNTSIDLSLRKKISFLQSSAKMFGYMPARPIFIDDDIVILRNDSTLMRWNFQNDQLVWKVKVSDKLIQNGGIVFDKKSDLLYVNAGSNFILAVNFKDGSIAWKSVLDSGSIREAPIIANNNVFVSSNDNKSYFLSREDGHINRLESTFYVDSKLMRSPVSTKYKDSIVTVYSNGNISIFDSKTTNLKFSFFIDSIGYNEYENIIGEITSKPNIIDNSTILLSTGGKTYFFDFNTGALDQSIDIDSHLDLIEVNKNTFLIASQEKRSVYLLNFNKKSNEVIWHYNLEDRFYDCAIMGSNIVLTFDKGIIGIIDILKHKSEGEKINFIELDNKVPHYISTVKDKIYLYSELFNYIEIIG